jgi:hypothetical protein
MHIYAMHQHARGTLARMYTVAIAATLQLSNSSSSSHSYMHTRMRAACKHQDYSAHLASSYVLFPLIDSLSINSIQFFFYISFTTRLTNSTKCTRLHESIDEVTPGTIHVYIYRACLGGLRLRLHERLRPEPCQTV